jgi:hypothetical protein
MRSLLISGILAGLAAGVALATLMTAVMPASPGLPMVVLMRLVLDAIGSEQWLTGWITVVGAGVVIGALFAGLLGMLGRDSATVAGTAVFLGFGLSAVGQLVVVPLLFDASPIATLTDRTFWPIIPFVLLASVLFTSVMAAAFLGIRTSERQPRSESASSDLRRAA